MNVSDKVYYAQMMPTIPQFEMLELSVRTITESWFVGIEKKSKHAYLFSNKAINKTVFYSRKECLDIVKKAEENCKKRTSDEVFYEEY